MKFKNNIHTWITDDTPTMPSHCNCNGSGKCTNRTSVKVGWPCSNKKYVQTCHKPQNKLHTIRVSTTTNTHTEPKHKDPLPDTQIQLTQTTEQDFFQLPMFTAVANLMFTWGEIESATTIHTTNLTIWWENLKMKTMLALFQNWCSNAGQKQYCS